MKRKEEELNAIVADLRVNYASLEEKFVKEEADKLVRLVSFIFCFFDKRICNLLIFLFCILLVFKKFLFAI